MYLLNRKNFLRKLNAKCVPLASSIFDTEYLMKNKISENINLVMLFDVYFVNGEDVRGRILNRTEEEVSKELLNRVDMKLSLKRWKILKKVLKNRIQIH